MDYKRKIKIEVKTPRKIAKRITSLRRQMQQQSISNFITEKPVNFLRLFFGRHKIKTKRSDLRIK